MICWVCGLQISKWSLNNSETCIYFLHLIGQPSCELLRSYHPKANVFKEISELERHFNIQKYATFLEDIGNMAELSGYRQCSPSAAAPPQVLTTPQFNTFKISQPPTNTQTTFSRPNWPPVISSTSSVQCQPDIQTLVRCAPLTSTEPPQSTFTEKIVEHLKNRICVICRKDLAYVLILPCRHLSTCVSCHIGQASLGPIQCCVICSSVFSGYIYISN